MKSGELKFFLWMLAVVKYMLITNTNILAEQKKEKSIEKAKMGASSLEGDFWRAFSLPTWTSSFQIDFFHESFGIRRETGMGRQKSETSQMDTYSRLQSVLQKSQLMILETMGLVSCSAIATLKCSHCNGFIAAWFLPQPVFHPLWGCSLWASSWKMMWCPGQSQWRLNNTDYKSEGILGN